MTFREVRNAVLFMALVALLYPLVKCVDGVLWVRTKWDKWRGVALILPLVAMPAMRQEPRPLAVGDRVIVVQDIKQYGYVDEIGPNGSEIGIVTKVEYRVHVETERWEFTVPESMVKRVGR